MPIQRREATTVRQRPWLPALGDAPETGRIQTRGALRSRTRLSIAERRRRPGDTAPAGQLGGRRSDSAEPLLLGDAGGEVPQPLAIALVGLGGPGGADLRAGQAVQDLGGRRLGHVVEVTADHHATVWALAVEQVGGGGAHGGGVGGAPARRVDRDAGPVALVAVSTGPARRGRVRRSRRHRFAAQASDARHIGNGSPHVHAAAGRGDEPDRHAEPSPQPVRAAHGHPRGGPAPVTSGDRAGPVDLPFGWTGPSGGDGCEPALRVTRRRSPVLPVPAAEDVVRGMVRRAWAHKAQTSTGLMRPTQPSWSRPRPAESAPMSGLMPGASQRLLVGHVARRQDVEDPHPGGALSVRLLEFAGQ